MSFKGIDKIQDAVDDLTEVLGEVLGKFKSNEENNRVYNLLLERTLEVREMIQDSRRKQKGAIHHDSAEVSSIEFSNPELVEEISAVVASYIGYRSLMRKIIKRFLIMVEKEYGHPVQREDVLRFYQEGKLQETTEASCSYNVLSGITNYLIIVGLLPLPGKDAKYPGHDYDAVRRERRKWRSRTT